MVEGGGFVHVIADEPHVVADDWVEGHDDDGAARDPAELADGRHGSIVPVVDGEYRHGGIDAAVTQGEGRRGSSRRVEAY